MSCKAWQQENRTSGLAYLRKDPTRALRTWHEGRAYALDHRVPLPEAVIARDAATAEAGGGDFARTLTFYDTAIDSFHQAGNIPDLGIALFSLVGCFTRLQRPTIAATLLGALPASLFGAFKDNLLYPGEAERLTIRLRSVLGEDAFQRCTETGAAIDPTEAVHYARTQIQLASQELQTDRPPPNIG